MGILTLNFNSINLDDTNCDEVNSETAIHIKLLTWHNTFEKHKTRTNDINKQLMLIAWYP